MKVVYSVNEIGSPANIHIADMTMGTFAVTRVWSYCPVSIFKSETAIR